MKLKLSDDPREDKARKAAAVLLLLGAWGMGRAQLNPQTWAIGGGSTFLEKLDMGMEETWHPPTPPPPNVFTNGAGNTVDRYSGVDLSFIDDSVVYGGIIRALISDADYVYAAGDTTLRVRKYNKADLSYVTQSPAITAGKQYYGLAQDEDYIYACSNDRKSDMAQTHQGAANGTYLSIDVDGTNIFCGGSWGRVTKYLQADCSFVALQAGADGYGGTINSLKVDGTHLYTGGLITRTVRRHLKTDMVFIDATAGYGGDLYAIQVDDDFVFAAGATTFRIRKYLKTDLSYIEQSPSYGNHIYAMDQNPTYLVAGGITQQRLRRYLKTDLSFVDESPVVGTTIQTVAMDLL